MSLRFPIARNPGAWIPAHRHQAHPRPMKPRITASCRQRPDNMPDVLFEKVYSQAAAWTSCGKGG
jgi:hypothetical protein